MRIYKEDYGRFKYVFDFPYLFETILFCRSLKTSVGASNLVFSNGKWRFFHLSIMEKILETYPETAIEASMQEDIELYELEKQKEVIRLKKAHELKKATDTTFKVNGIKGELRPYQRIGVEFFINNKGKAILADEQGVGKSLQALAFVVHTKKEKTLIISPASVKWAWASETTKWSSLKPFVIDAQTKFTDETYREHQVFVLNYDIVRKFFDKLSVLRWDCIICDEFQAIKNIRARRTQLVKKLAKNIPSILLLSGTPLLNRTVELFNGLQLMDEFKWNNWFEYTKKYCNAHVGRFGWDVSGVSHIDELQKEISQYFLRRVKKDILPELPPKQFIDIPIQLDNDTRRKYELAEDLFIEYLKNVKNKTDAEIRKSLQAEALVKLGELRKLTSMGKLDSAIEIIENIVNGGEKVVVFSVYNEPLELLAEYFKRSCVMITGKTKDSERKNIIESFQNNPKKVIFLGGMKSAGVGITLTAASNVIFIDFSFVPADHSQSMDRIHRIGQKAESVSIYQLFAKDTIDEKMKNILKTKQKIFDQLIEGKEVERTGTNFIKEIIHTYEA